MMFAIILAAMVVMIRADFCYYNGDIYSGGEPVPSSEHGDVCQMCWCPPEGGEVTCEAKVCRILDCVDPEPTGLCCSECPHGTSCIMDEPEIQGTMYGSHVQLVVRDGNCDLWCQCPGPEEYEIRGIHTRAVCTAHCVAPRPGA